MPQNDTLRKLRTMEAKINRNLYLICGGVTVLTMIMMLVEFLTRGAFPPTKISLFYLGVLLLYSLHKELVRWMGDRKVDYQGEYFVYGWIGLTTLLYIVNFLSKDYFSHSIHGAPLVALKEASILTLEVLAIFLVTRGSKLIKVFLVKKQK